MRRYAKPGDIVDCPLVSKPVTISKIYSQDYYGPGQDEGWQLEFEDTTGEYRSWKQRCDGGELIQPEVACVGKYLTFNEVLNKIGAAALLKKDTDMRYWCTRLGDLIEYSIEQYANEECVLGLCTECGNYVPVTLSEFESNPDYWWCDECDAEFEEFLDDLDGVDPQIDEHEAWRRLDAEAHKYYYDSDDADYSDEEYCGDDKSETFGMMCDISGMMMCDISGVCCGPNCENYYECNSICKG